MGAHQGGREAAVTCDARSELPWGGGTVPLQLSGGQQIMPVLLGTAGQKVCIQGWF